MSPIDSLSYAGWPVFRIQTVLRQEGKGHAFQTEGHAPGVCRGSIGELAVQVASEEVLVVIIGAYRQGGVFERQPGANLELELEGALEGCLFAEFPDKERISGAFDPVSQPQFFKNGHHALAGNLPVLEHIILRADKNDLTHGEVPQALEGCQVAGFVPEAVADRSRSQASALQGAVCQGEVEMVANRWREQRLNPGEGFCRYIEPMLVAGGVQRKMVDRVQVFPQVGNEG